MGSESKIKMTLRWEKFDGALSHGLHELLGEKELVDVTLACQGEYVKAHKNVLSVCSPYFRALFKANPCKHPIVILQEARLSHIRALLQFMYCGETTVPQNELASFLRTAETLKIKGLSDSDTVDSNNEDESSSESIEATSSSKPPPAKRKRQSEPDLLHSPPLVSEPILSWTLPSGTQPTLPTISRDQVSAEFVNFNQIKEEAEVSQDDFPLEWRMDAGAQDDIEFVESRGETDLDPQVLAAPMCEQPGSSQQAGVSVINATSLQAPDVTARQNNISNSGTADLLGSILDMQPVILQRENTITQLMSQLRTVKGGPMQFRDKLPARTVEDIIQLEHSLASDKDYLAKMSASLGLLGGKNPYQAVRRTLTEVIGHEVAEQYRWSGTIGKRHSITTLPNVVKLITNAALLNPASRCLSVTEIENILKVWLRSSGDRDGGRNRRRIRGLEKQHQDPEQTRSRKQYSQNYVTYRRSAASTSNTPSTSHTDDN